jgi:hypothetical protein
MASVFDLQWGQINSFLGSFTSLTLTYNRHCPVCGELKAKPVTQLDNFQFFSDSTLVPKRANVAQVQCERCAAIYMNPCYTSEGFRYLFGEAGQSYGAMSERPEEQVGWLKSRGLLQDGLVFLDVGCFEGAFLNSLPNGLKRVGVDIDAPAVARGNAKYADIGVSLYCGPLETFDIPWSPDVISMYHVLEHVANPLDVLRHLRTVANALTSLVVEVPILEFGDTNDIGGFFSVQHMTHFSHDSLTSLVHRAGWEIIERQQIEGYNGHRLLLAPGKVIADFSTGAADVVRAQKYMAHWFASLATVGERLNRFGDSSRWVIWGGGFHTEVLYQVTPFFNKYAAAKFICVDSDESKHGKSWRGIAIHPPSVLTDIDWQDTRLLVSSYGSQDVIKNAAIKLAVPEERIACLYDHVVAY